MADEAIFSAIQVEYATVCAAARRRSEGRKEHTEVMATEFTAQATPLMR
ncbi:hypothetical protein KCP76_11070 [Salmonella enterica subsp. enterica serovar Weltevreden]|nr:hypothetical protein KCP76_11070 [Salmonella enterica subsp. enterica serovar Weltevreden]